MNGNGHGAPWTLYFVAMALNGPQRVIYEVKEEKLGTVLLERKLTVHGKGIDPPFSYCRLDLVSVEKDYVVFYAPVEEVRCPLVGIFDSYEEATMCAKVPRLAILDDRWLAGTQRHRAFLRKYFFSRNPTQHAAHCATCR